MPPRSAPILETRRQASSVPVTLGASRTTSAQVEVLPAHGGSVPAWKKLDILLAEGNPIIRSVIAKILQRRGHKVEQVASGEAAVATLVKDPYHLAVLAIDLPGISGLEVTKLVRFARTGRPHLPVIGLTGEETDLSIAGCMNAGMDACLLKMIEPGQLIALVESFMSASLCQPQGTEIPPTTSAMPDLPSKEQRAAIDPTVLADLEKLGGKPFVDEIVSQFLSDARITLDALNEAVRQVDAPTFHDQAHALRSCAANVGARPIYEKCLAWRALSEADLATHGSAYMHELEANLTEASRILGDYLAGA